MSDERDAAQPPKADGGVVPAKKWPLGQTPLHRFKIGDEVSIAEGDTVAGTGRISDFDASGSRNYARIEYPDDTFEWVTLGRVYRLGRAPKAAPPLNTRPEVGGDSNGAFKTVLASLVAAVSLLEQGGKKAAASDKMFETMLNDYRKAIATGRSALTAVSPVEQGEPVAWAWEYCCQSSGEWRLRTRTYKPTPWAGIRNIRPLGYLDPAPAASRPAVGREEIALRIQNEMAEHLSVDSDGDVIGTGKASYRAADQILALLDPRDDTRAGGGELVENSRDPGAQTRAKLVNTGTPQVVSPHSGD